MYIQQIQPDVIKTLSPFVPVCMAIIGFVIHRFWGAVAAIGGSIIGGLLSSSSSSSAAKSAAKSQAGAAVYATDAQLKMWEQAQQDFAPYLEAGETGLATLTERMPQYVNQTLVPIAQQFGNYQLSPLPSETTGMVNPITGQITPYSPDINQGVVGQTQAYTPSLPLGRNNWLQAAEASGGAQTTRSGYPIPGLNMPLQAAGVMGTAIQGALSNALSQGEPINYTMPQIGYGNAMYPQTGIGNVGATPAQLQAGGVLSPTVPDFQRPMNLQQYGFTPSADLPNAFSSQAALPDVPNIATDLDYQFNTNDPVYQQKLAEKTAQINTFLAKQGLAGSTAGETFRQNELNKLLAEEEQRQYDRAISERNFLTGAQTAQFGMGLDLGNTQFGQDVTGYGLNMDRSNTLYGRQLGENELAFQRALGERNYLTQADIDQYRLAAERGNTLYGRQYQAGSDMYNRAMGNALTGDTRNQQQLMDIYNLMGSLYGTQYGTALDLANLGSQATSATGAGALQTGQAVGQNAMAAGNALAQSQLAQGKIDANMYSQLGNLPLNIMTAQNYQNAFQPQSSYYGGGGYSNMSYNPSGYSDISWNY